MPPLTDNKPLVENGVVVGNTYNKYESSNPLVRRLVAGFESAVMELAGRADPQTILEVGCGEGHITRILLENTTASIRAMDISDTVLAAARDRVRSERADFEKRNIYDLVPADSRSDLVVCCEVLEHLDDPEEGLRLLAETARPWAIISVPREPLWRGLNLLRGAYWRDLGNSPGHLQHWSKQAFIRFVASRFAIQEVRSPLPWTMLLAQTRH